MINSFQTFAATNKGGVLINLLFGKSEVTFPFFYRDIIILKCLIISILAWLIRRISILRQVWV